MWCRAPESGCSDLKPSTGPLAGVVFGIKQTGLPPVNCY